MCDEATVTRRVRLVLDSDPESPREWDNLGTIVGWHSRYNLGDEQPAAEPAEWARYLAADLVDADDADLIPDEHVSRILDKHVVILPVHIYEHGGVALSCSGFSDPWDSGQVGYVYCTLQQARENWLLPGATWETEVTDHENNKLSIRDYAAQILRAEVETYSQYLDGDVYGFICEERETCDCCGRGTWEHVDSCFGFYGSDTKTNGMADHMPDDEWLALLHDADVSYE